MYIYIYIETFKNISNNGYQMKYLPSQNYTPKTPKAPTPVSLPLRAGGYSRQTGLHQDLGWWKTLGFAWIEKENTEIKEAIKPLNS